MPAFAMASPRHALGLSDAGLAALAGAAGPLIGGRRVGGEGASFAVVSPVDGREMADVAGASAAQISEAALAARTAMEAWRRHSPSERAEILLRWRGLILAAADDLAELVMWEQGRARSQALDEVRYAAAFLSWFAGEAERVFGEILPSAPGRRLLARRRPIGVVAAMTPWNAPLSMVTRKCGAALAAGCGVVLRPSEQTPLCALALGELALRAGLPPGLFNVVSMSDGALFVESVCDDGGFRKLTFTGSTEVGRAIAARCARSLLPVALELGGNAAFVVLDDADPILAAKAAMTAKFRAAGQSCVAANRFFVSEAVVDAFVAELSRRLSELCAGDPRQADVEVGPVVNRRQLDRLQGVLDRSIAEGAQIMARTPLAEPLHDLVFAPTLVRFATPERLADLPELFGPILAYAAVRPDDDVAGLIHRSSYGLANYVISSDPRRAERLAEQLECGMVGINTGLISQPSIPFGGVRDSGWGREGSRHGVEEFTVLNYTCIADMAT